MQVEKPNATCENPIARETPKWRERSQQPELDAGLVYISQQRADITRMNVGASVGGP